MTHIDAGDLVRFVDDECAAPERAALTAHLGSCASCTVQLRELERSVVAVRIALRTLDEAPPAGAARWRNRRVLAAAAVILASATMVSPVRAWMTTRVAALWRAVASPRTELPGEITNGPAATLPHVAGVAFVPVGDRFTLDVSDRQAGGEVVVAFAATDTAAATIQGDTHNESLVVLPSGLRIATAPPSTATYRLTLPSRLRQVSVVIGGEAAVRIPVTAVGATWQIRLAPGARAPVRTDRP